MSDQVKQKAADERCSMRGIATRIMPWVCDVVLGESELEVYTKIPWKDVARMVEAKISSRAITNQDQMADLQFAYNALSGGYTEYIKLFRQHCGDDIREMTHRHRDVEVAFLAHLTIAQALLSPCWTRAAVNITDTRVDIIRMCWDAFQVRYRGEGKSASAAYTVCTMTPVAEESKSSKVKAQTTESIKANKRALDLIRIALEDSIQSIDTDWRPCVEAAAREQMLSEVILKRDIVALLQSADKIASGFQNDTAQMKKLVQSGVSTLDTKMIETLRKKRLGEFLEYTQYLREKAPMNGGMESFLEKEQSNLSRRLVRRENTTLETLKSAYIPTRTTALRSEFLSQWIQRLEHDFRVFQGKVDAIVHAYSALPSASDAAESSEVSAALATLQTTVSELCSGIQTKLTETSEMEGATSAESSAADAKSQLARLMDMLTQLEYGEYISVVFNEMIVFIDENEREKGEDPADSLIKFLERYKSLTHIPKAYHFLESEWKTLELAAITGLDSEVDGFISPLMKSFQQGGELHAEAATLMKAIKEEKASLQKQYDTSGSRFDIFEVAEWNPDSPLLHREHINKSLLAKPAHFDSGEEWETWLIDNCAKPLEKMYRTASAKTAFGKCRLDARDLQTLILRWKEEGSTFVAGKRAFTVREFWTFTHLLYFTATVIDQNTAFA